MPPLVTTSSRKHRKSRRLPLFAAGLPIVLGLLFAVFRAESHKTPEAANASESASVGSGGGSGAQTRITEQARPETEAGDKAEKAEAPAEEPTGTAREVGGSATVGPAEPEAPAEKRPKDYRHPTEQLLAMMLSTPDGSEMPPLPDLSGSEERLNADILNAITNDLVIWDDDSPATERLKERVAEMKIALAAAVADGGDLSAMLNEFRDYRNEGATIRFKVVQDVNKIADDAEAYQYLQDANAALGKEDVVPIEPGEVGFVTEDNGVETEGN